MNRPEIKINRIVSKIWTDSAPILYFSTRGTAAQILKAIRFFISRRFIYERSVEYMTIHLREVSHQYPWRVTGVFFHMQNYGPGVMDQKGVKVRMWGTDWMRQEECYTDVPVSNAINLWLVPSVNYQKYADSERYRWKYTYVRSEL